MTERSSSEAEFAWAGGDRPRDTAFGHAVGPEVARRIIEAVPDRLLNPADREGARLTALAPGGGLVGRYRLQTGAFDAFLRVTARWGAPQREADVVDHLARLGESVNPMLACGVPVQDPAREHRLRMDIRPMLGAGTHFTGDERELESLGRSLCGVHRALAAYPNAGAIAWQARERFARLQALSEGFARNPRAMAEGLEPYREWIRTNAEWCAAAAAEVGPSLLADVDDAQCVHGEPHQANVLFVDGHAILLDFEETVHLYVSPRWDLAFAVQRFVLAGEPDEGERSRRLAALEHGYGAPVFDQFALRCVAWTTLLIVFDLWQRQRIRTPLSECDKFMRHEQDAVALTQPRGEE